MVYSAHGFLMYPLAAMANGATPVKAPEENYTASVDALLSVVTPKTKLVFLANPNNPTGTYLPSSELRRLRAGLPDDVLFVFDSAYAEFINHNDYTPGIDLVDGHDNVVMTRTFSKIHGFARPILPEPMTERAAHSMSTPRRRPPAWPPYGISITLTGRGPTIFDG